MNALRIGTIVLILSTPVLAAQQIDTSGYVRCRLGGNTLQSCQAYLPACAPDKDPAICMIHRRTGEHDYNAVRPKRVVNPK